MYLQFAEYEPAGYSNRSTSQLMSFKFQGQLSRGSKRGKYRQSSMTRFSGAQHSPRNVEVTIMFVCFSTGKFEKLFSLSSQRLEIVMVYDPQTGPTGSLRRFLSRDILQKTNLQAPLRFS